MEPRAQRTPRDNAANALPMMFCSVSASGMWVQWRCLLHFFGALGLALRADALGGTGEGIGLDQVIGHGGSIAVFERCNILSLTAHIKQ